MYVVNAVNLLETHVVLAIIIKNNLLGENMFKTPFVFNATTTKTTTPMIPTSSRKKALCAGINDYPGTGNDLRGCVPDAKAWIQLLSTNYGFNIKSLFDSQVKHSVFTEIFGNYVADSKSGDSIVITFSGHGTNIPDLNGDEEDGREEALCLYDGLLIDDAIRAILQNLHPEAKLTIISDSCHSGTVTRAFLSTMNGKDHPRPRYMPFDDNSSVFSRTNITKKIFKPEEEMNEILISGCLPNEYSYDAKIGGTFRGAMSYYAIEILKKYPSITYENFYTHLRADLPSGNYPQTPQLESKLDNKKTVMFA